MLDIADISRRLTAIFHEVFEDDSIELFDAMTADDVDEWDSVSHISLVLAVEKGFGVSLSASEIGELANVGAMFSLLAEKLSSKA